MNNRCIRLNEQPAGPMTFRWSVRFKPLTSSAGETIDPARNGIANGIVIAVPNHTRESEWHRMMVFRCAAPLKDPSLLALGKEYSATLTKKEDGEEISVSRFFVISDLPRSAKKMMESLLEEIRSVWKRFMPIDISGKASVSGIVTVRNDDFCIGPVEEWDEISIEGECIELFRG